MDQVSEQAAAVGVDVELADLVDVRVERRRELPLQLGRHGFALGFQPVERVLGGDEVPGDDRVCDEVQAGGADALAVEGGEAELAVVAVEEEVVQGVHRFVLVELAADRLSLFGAGVVAQDEPGFDDPPALLQRAGELAAVWVRLEPLNEEAGGDVPVLDRGGDPLLSAAEFGQRRRVMAPFIVVAGLGGFARS